LCYFCAVLCRICRTLCHAPCGRFWHCAVCTPWHSGGCKCSQGIFTGVKHREFCATFVLVCAIYAEFCATPLMGDSPCSLWQILTLCRVYTVTFLRVSVFPNNFQICEELWILCYFCAILCHIGRILCHAPYERFWRHICHVYTVAFWRVWVFPRNFHESEGSWILCYFCAILCRICRILCHAPCGRFLHYAMCHCCILVGLSIPEEFSSIWSTVNFVLLLRCFVPYTRNFVPRPLCFWRMLWDPQECSSVHMA